MFTAVSAAISLGVGFVVGWFTRGYDDAETIEHLENDLDAARRAARKRAMETVRWDLVKEGLKR